MSISRAHAVGQLLVIALDESRWNTSCERLLRTYCPGGVVLSARHSPESIAGLLGNIGRTLTIPSFLGLEGEGGPVDPLQAFLGPLPSPRAAAQKGLSAVARLGELVGRGLKLLGFNFHDSPVLDLSTPFSEPILGTRTFSSEAHEVARCGDAFLRGLRRHKILPCAKHFPGFGSAQVDSHSSVPLIRKTMAELWREDLVPYRKLLGQLPLVRVSHAAYKAYDYNFPCPATLSRNVVEGLLRLKLGYSGVAAGDFLETKTIRRTLDLGEAAVQSVNAGCDLLLVGRSEESIAGVLGGLKKGIESEKVSTRRLEQALGRIRLAKKSLALPSGILSRRDLDQLAREFEDFGKECQPQEQRIA